MPEMAPKVWGALAPRAGRGQPRLSKAATCRLDIVIRHDKDALVLGRGYP